MSPLIIKQNTFVMEMQSARYPDLSVRVERLDYNPEKCRFIMYRDGTELGSSIAKTPIRADDKLVTRVNGLYEINMLQNPKGITTISVFSQFDHNAMIVNSFEVNEDFLKNHRLIGMNRNGDLEWIRIEQPEQRTTKPKEKPRMIDRIKKAFHIG